MKSNVLKTIGVLALFLIINACGGGTDVVESGTYTGEIANVEPEKREIYVDISDSRTLELYFTDQTTLTKNGQSVDFSALEQGQKVEVEVEKVGKRLDPLSVKIVE